ncbi:MAG TPA: C45 family peptidase [Planctomycetota bacterium]|nr:C45 family peptidase [Planctomycetota bacterium]
MAKLLPSFLPEYKYRGSIFNCGRQYGHEHAEGIAAQVADLAGFKPVQRKFAAACSRVKWKHGRLVESFIRGMGEASKQSYQDLYSFLCYEEMGRMKHCTGLAATGHGTVDGKPIIGENWDGVRRQYAWPTLMRLHADTAPATLFYVSTPGLWSCAGINEWGMSLVWTSAAHYLRKKHTWAKVGVPTYALVAGVLACRTCKEAVELLRQTPNAGGFIFFIADATGEAGVVEAVPHRTHYIQCKDVLGRANHLESDEMVGYSRQHVGKSTPQCNTLIRGVRIAKLLRQYRGKIDRAAVETMLRDEKAPPGLTICQSAANGNICMTVDSFYCLPAKREFWIARGLQTRHAYERHRI